MDLPGVWQQNAAEIYGYETVQGYHGVQMAAPMRLSKALEKRQLEWVDLMNGRYVISPQAQCQAGWTEPWASPVWVYENPAALPRAFWTTSSVMAKDDDAAFQLLAQPGFPVLQAVTLPKDPGLAVGPVAGGATFTKAESPNLEIEASNDKAALLVISQTWYPTWTATVDGHAARPCSRRTAARSRPCGWRPVAITSSCAAGRAPIFGWDC